MFQQGFGSTNKKKKKGKEFPQNKRTAMMKSIGIIKTSTYPTDTEWHQLVLHEAALVDTVSLSRGPCVALVYAVGQLLTNSVTIAIYSR